MDEDDIPDTRVFVSGLPPHYTSEQLGAHFAGRYQITDSVVLPGRRIGFVGFRNYTLAKNAVKYFDKSYIRMSKINVEIAKPVEFHRETNAEPEAESHKVSVSQSKLTPSGKYSSSDSKSAFVPYQSLTTKPSNKRKRVDGEEQSSEMKEYMEVMKPKSTSTWTNGESTPRVELIKSRGCDDTTSQDIGDKQKKKEKSFSSQGKQEQGSSGATAAAEVSDIDKRRRKKERKEKKKQPDADDQTPNIETVEEDKEARRKRKAEEKMKKAKSEGSVEGGVEPFNDNASAIEVADTDIAQPKEPRSDNEWLRGKTSRLLDLMDPNEQTGENDEAQPSNALVPANSDDEDGVTASDPDEPSTAVDAAVVKASTTQDFSVPNGRLFVRNLPFSATETDLEATFAKYGSIAEVHISRDFRSSSSRGMAFVQFADAQAAESALRILDGKAFQGRLLHILPASDRKASQLDDFTLSKMPLKKQRAIKQKQDAATSSFNWNSLYMNPDAVLSSVADRLGVSKSDVLDPTSSDAAVKQALAETNTIKDTKEYLQGNGINIDAFKCAPRDERSILIKNFSFGTTADELRALLEPFGTVVRLVLPPTGTMAIAQYENAQMASKGLKHLAYRNLKGSVLFLEAAPEGLFDTAKEIPGISKPGASAAMRGALDFPDAESATVFVRNLNFATTRSRLAEIFSPLSGYLTATVKTRTDSKRPGEILSMGFGFVEFKSKQQATAAIIAMNGYKLDGHELLVKASTKVLDAAEETRKADKDRKIEKKTKIIVKNLPFEASKKDVRALFEPYGQLRTIRVPKKFDSTTRGFAFADFVSAREAENAMEALANTHLLGRRLVLEFAAGEVVDPEEEIQALERKIGQQTEMVNLSKIMSSTRRRFNVEAGAGDEGV